MKTLKKALSIVKTKTNSRFPIKVTERCNHLFYCLFDASRFSDICTIKELKELNWLRKHMKIVRSSQPSISKNFVLNSAKHKFFHLSIVNITNYADDNTLSELCNTIEEVILLLQSSSRFFHCDRSTRWRVSTLKSVTL